MSLEVIKFAFIAGELSPTFFGRSDLEKFDLGLAEATNWFVDYRGGLSTRPGTVFCEFIKDDDQLVKLFQFKFAPTIANTYVMLFGDHYIRFLQQGAYVLEDGKAITAITQDNPGVMAAPAHGFANGDWVKFSGINGMTRLNGRTAIVTAVATNTFQLTDHRGNPIDTSGYGAYTSGGSVFRVYEIDSPYGADDLAGLTLYQKQDLIRVTHKDFPPHDLERNDATDWTLTETVFGATIDRPENLVTHPQDTGPSEVAFAVTAVNAEGEESLASEVTIERDTADYTTVRGNIRLSWDVVPAAISYRIYRSTIVTEANGDLTRGAELGYIGRVSGASFVDSNIIPDFTRSPPLHYNPFAQGSIDRIETLTVGTGYTDASEVIVTDPDGTGFVGYPIVDITGQVVGVVVQDGGEGYTAPVVSFTVGTGATATAHVGPLDGTYPALSCVFQQREIYAASIQQPLTVWGSRPGQLNNFDVSSVVSDADSYEFDLDSDEVTPIQHIIPMRGGLLIMSQGGVYQLTGGGVGDAVTATNVLVDPHSYTGVSEVVPIKIDTDLLYVENKGYTVRLLSYNDYSKIYSGEDVSILSNHLFNTTNFITRWSFASDPFKLAWARRLDGALLSFTVVKEQKVFAWAKHFTKGFFEDVLAVQEDRTDVVYLVVKRLINGEFVQYVEQLAPRTITNVEDVHCLDAGLSLGGSYPAADITMSAASGTIVVTADANIFTAGDVGKVFRAGGGKGLVSLYMSPTTIQVELINPITNVLPEDPNATTLPLLQGEWTLDTKVGSVDGMWHLEGETVNVLLDGNVSKNLTVTDGRVTFGTTGSRAVVGLPFRCQAKSLPLTVPQGIVEGRRKRVVGVAARFNETRGLKFGQRLDKLYEFKERSNEAYGEPTRLISGVKTVLSESVFDDDAQVYFVQNNPLPATLLGFVLDTEIGDDPE